MATFYWVGGTGTWSGTSTTNWAASSGGAGGAGVPGSADDVVFDANSNVGTGTFTVTTSGTPLCRNFTAGSLDGAMTLTVSAALSVYGNFTAPATNFSVTSGTVALTFVGSGTQTITSNGVTLTAINIQTTGTVTLADALNIGARQITITTGTFDTAGYNVTCNNISASQTIADISTINLNNSTITIGNGIALISDWVTLNAGTSTIVFSSATAFLNTSRNFTTFYNVSFTSTSSSTALQIATSLDNGAAFNNLSFATPAAAPYASTIFLIGKIKVNGTLTVPVGSTTASRVNTVSFLGAPSTLEVANVSGSFINTNFKSITATGASAPWSGTNLGDGGGNSGITGFAAPKTVYWSQLAGGSTWDNAWASSSGGAPALSNFPLAQDTIIFDNTGLNTSATVTATGITCRNMDFSTRSNAMTFSGGTTTFYVCGNFTLSSAITISGTFNTRIGRAGVASTVTTAGRTLTFGFQLVADTGSITFADNFTSSSGMSLISGNINLNGKTFSFTSLSPVFFADCVVNLASATLTGTAAFPFSANFSRAVFVGSCTFNASSASAKTINNNACLDLSGFNIVNTGAGALTFTNIRYDYPVPVTSAQYGNLTTTVRPLTVNFTAGQTFGFANFGISGTAGNLVTLQTTTAGTQATLYGYGGVVNLRYASVKDLRAQGYTEWNAIVDEGAVDLGNNVGWNFITLGIKKILRKVFSRQIIRPVIEEIQ